MSNKAEIIGKIITIIPIVTIIILIIVVSVRINLSFKNNAKTFRLLSSESNKIFDNELINYAKSQNIKLEIDHYGDLEMVDILNSGEQNYDGVWISNSI